jgi:hypothetical protein
MDRLVCADGGNPDPTSTAGKNAQKAKEIELNGWDYPRHLAGRVFSVVVHGDTAGADTLKDNLANWLEDMGLIDCCRPCRRNRQLHWVLQTVRHESSGIGSGSRVSGRSEKCREESG